MTVLQFEDFEMDIPCRSLKRNGLKVRLGSRAFDLLTALASRSGEILSKAELMEAAWPDTNVEESSLRVNIVALRKALDTGASSLVENVAGRGYTFTVPVRKLDGVDYSARKHAYSEQNALPGRYSRMVGREELIVSWAGGIDFGITTIVGHGGVGKTCVAIEIAHRIKDIFEIVYFIDIADSDNDDLSLLATALKAENTSVEVDHAAVESLVGKTVLIVIDGCERSINRVASIAEAIVDSNPDAAILATSREPIGVIGENVRHLPGLSFPTEINQVESIAAFSGIELFAERVSMVAELCLMENGRDLQLAAEIVRKTDGNPLAIELAASRVADLGLENLLLSLDRPLKALRRGNRTSHPRQQTLRASIDWSFDLCNGRMQTLLVQLSALDTEFSKSRALEIAGVDFDRSEFEEAFDGLLVKSLITGLPNTQTYSLPAFIREYAREKLYASELLNSKLSTIGEFTKELTVDYPRPRQPAFVSPRLIDHKFEPVANAA